VTLSTKEIRTMIDDVRGAVNTTVMRRAGSKAVDAGAAQVPTPPSRSGQIAPLGTTTDAAREIRALDEDTSTGVEAGHIAITNVAQTTRETEASGRRPADFGAADEAVDELSRLVQTARLMHRIVSLLPDEAREIIDQLGTAC